MNISSGWIGAFAAAASLALAPARHHHAPRPHAAPLPACSTDSSYQRLAFWVGDWEVLDSTGAHYAYQNVRAVIDDCAITAEWTGRVGDRGFNLSSYDGRTKEWRQMYVSNQVPTPLGVTLRRSDSTYTGPGVRFIPLLDPPAGVTTRSRVTIMPLSDHRAMQLFEDSRDGGQTWRVIFRAEHRLRATSAP